MTVAVIGLGLMGGSLAWALRRCGGHVRGYARREETRREALGRGICDEVFSSAAEAAAGCELAVICTPVKAVPGLLAELVGAGLEGLLVTDVSSTKEWVVGECERICAGGTIRFLGSHPICGSEKAGLEHADPELYRNSVTVLTPTPRSTAADRKRLKSFWSGLGSQVEELSPVEHDRILARTSHVPHLLAALMVRRAAQAGEETAGRFSGTGFRDTTRIASGPAGVWKDILITNAPEVSAELEAAIGELRRVVDMLKGGREAEVESWLEEARTLRERILDVARGVTR